MDGAATTGRRDKDNFDGLHYILRRHTEDWSQTQREIIDDRYFQAEARHNIAARLGITV